MKNEAHVNASSDLIQDVKDQGDGSAIVVVATADGGTARYKVRTEASVRALLRPGKRAPSGSDGVS